MRLNEGDIVKILQPGMNTKFMQGAGSVQADWKKIADFVQSTQATETYPWLGNLPDPSEFRDERKRRKMSEYNFSIANKEYEVSVGIKRSTLDDDQYGQLNNIATKLGVSFGRWFNKQIFALASAGATTVCYDGSNMIDTTHSEGNSGTQSNKTTSALSSATYATARAGMMTFKDDQGNPAGIMPNLLVVPGALEQTGAQIVKAQLIQGSSAGIENVFKGSADLLVSSWLADTNDWFLIDTTGNKPFILQERIALEVGFEKVFRRNEVDYGAYWRGNFGYGDWRTIYGGIV